MEHYLKVKADPTAAQAACCSAAARCKVIVVKAKEPFE